MKGIIFLWYGSILSIPEGWALCDGTQGTPDMNYKFLLGAGTTYNPGDKTTTWSHYHNFTGDGHMHDIGPAERILAGDKKLAGTSSDPAAGRTNYTHAFPPYHALCYIMKLP